MECTLATLIACFSWGGFYVDTEMSYQDRAVPYHYWKNVSPRPRSGVIETAFVSTISYEQESPYMRNAIGYQLKFRSVDLSAELFHDSSMKSDKDRGVNGVGIRARWFPFRARR